MGRLSPVEFAWLQIVWLLLKLEAEKGVARDIKRKLNPTRDSQRPSGDLKEGKGRRSERSRKTFI
jgi:hypothetical protein